MLGLFIDNLRNRLKGETNKANAQLGLVSAPEGKSKLIWIHAGKTRHSVMLAAAILAAIREKRLDVRLVLTYQNEYQDIIVQHLSGLKKTGFGFGCANNKNAAMRMIKRLQPFAVIFVGEKIPENILRATQDAEIKHRVAFQTAIHHTANVEACYPGRRDSELSSAMSADYVSETFDAITQLVQAQVDKQLGALIQGEDAKPIYLLHGANKESARKMLEYWQGSALNGSAILSFTLDEPNGQGLAALIEAVQQSGLQPLNLSQWQKTSLSTNQVIIADEARWFAAMAVASNAAHILSASDYSLWQMLASGASLSYSADLSDYQKKLFPKQCEQLNIDSLCHHWQTLQSNQLLQRSSGDACRKVFWQARRQAEQGIEDFLQRVYEW